MATTRTIDLKSRIEAAKAASRIVGRMPGAARDAMLHEIADAMVRRTDEIISENRDDVSDARAAHVSPALVDRLYLDEDRIADMARAVRVVAGLPDPIGVVDRGWRRPNGLEILRKRVPLGVIGIIYEGRPNVTTDAAALCLKSGNAVVLRGSRVARRSNQILAGVIESALREVGAPPAAVTMLGTDRQEMIELVQMNGLVDLVIPRGGLELKAALTEHATVPVIYAAAGNCHVYVDVDADISLARDIILNAKVQRPGVCNAAETLLVHRAIAADALPMLVDALRAAEVEIRMCADGLSILGSRAEGILAATDEDYATEFLSLTIAVKLVGSLDDGIEHINTYGTGHSEAIVTTSLAAAREFQEGVDAACVYVNASTRFTDGGEFGMGAEIGNSTQKLHARGPIGPEELTTIKYLVTGEGHVR